MSKKIQRLRYIDIVKGIAIICIILGHCNYTPVNNFVFTFHVPIFFLITGYFISEKDDILTFIEKKLKALIKPYCIISLLLIVFATVLGFIYYGKQGALYNLSHWVYAALYGAGDSYTTPFYIKAIGAIWFLWATFWGSILVKVSLKFKPILRVLFLTAIFLIGYYSTKLFWFPLSIQAGFCATLWLYVGYLCKKYQKLYINTSEAFKILLFLISLLIWILFIINFKTFWLVHCNIGRGVIDIIGSLCASYVIVICAKKIDSIPYISNFLAIIGSNTLYVLAIHVLEDNFFPWIYVVRYLYNYGLFDNQVIFIYIFSKCLLVLFISVLVIILRDAFKVLKSS